MSFWDLEDGEKATDTGTEYESGGGNFEVIPNNTDVLAAPDEAKFSKFEENEYISIRWTVLKPEIFKNRKVFQKLWVTDDDPKAKDPAKKRDKAKRMLAAIDANAGGKLAKNGKRPTDDSLTMALVNKPMVIKLMTWEFKKDNGEEMSGNWISAVSPKTAGISTVEEIAAKPKPKAKAAPEVMDDEIPF